MSMMCFDFFCEKFTYLGHIYLRWAAEYAACRDKSMPMIDSPPPILDFMVVDGLEGCLREGFPFLPHFLQ